MNETAVLETHRAYEAESLEMLSGGGYDLFGLGWRPAVEYVGRHRLPDA